MTTAPATPATTWAATLGQIQMIITPANYDTWLRDTIGLRYDADDHTFVVGAPSAFATEWLHTKLRPILVKTLARVLGHAVEVTFEVVAVHGIDAPALIADPIVATDLTTGGVPSPTRRNSAPPPAIHPALTFDTFVVADENRLAHQAARSCIVEPGKLNPLFIVGSSGLGKTHLLSAIGHEAYEQGLNVIYAPAERFGNDYVKALGPGSGLGGGIEQFRRRYRNADVLLIDDVQFFEGKEKFQDEFFHTFNDLQSAGKQVVISGDRMPSQLVGLMDALRGRLQWGLVADLQKPSFATRLAILRAKVQQHAHQLPDAALELIAERCCPTVRELEGYLNRVLAYMPLVGGKTTADVIERALSPLSPVSALAADDPPDVDTIIIAVCRRTGTDAADLRGRSRTRDVTYARHLAMFILKEDGRKTPAEIGRLFGNRDHSTVLAGITRITHEQTTREETKADLTAIRETLTRPHTTNTAIAV